MKKHEKVTKSKLGVFLMYAPIFAPVLILQIPFAHRHLSMHSCRRLSGLTPVIPLHVCSSTFSDSSVPGSITLLAFLFLNSRADLLSVFKCGFLGGRLQSSLLPSLCEGRESPFLCCPMPFCSQLPRLQLHVLTAAWRWQGR